MVFSFLFKWAFKLVLPVAIIVGILFYLASGIENTELDSFDLTGISDITVDSFSVQGNLYVTNPSDLPVSNSINCL